MDEFKTEFEHVFKHAPSFSLDAKEVIAAKQKRINRSKWLKISIPGIAIAIVALLLVILQPFINQFESQSAALTMKREILHDFSKKEDQQFVVAYELNGMNRGSDEYKGHLLFDTNLETLNYGQVILYEVGQGYSQELRYELARIVGLPGDKVAIRNGQIYVNNREVTAFYGQAQIFGKQTVEDVKIYLKEKGMFLLDEAIKRNLTLTLPQVTVGKNEVFAVTDNWSFTSIQQTIETSEIEGIVKGYVTEDLYSYGFSNSGRIPTEAEQQLLTPLVMQTVESYQTKNKDLLEKIASELSIELLYDEGNKEFDTELTLENYIINNFDESAVAFESFKMGVQKSSIIYFEPAVLATDNVKLYLRKKAQIDLLNEDESKVLQLTYRLINGEWKFESFYFMDAATGK
jgi:signal peptidase I